MHPALLRALSLLIARQDLLQLLYDLRIRASTEHCFSETSKQEGRAQTRIRTMFGQHARRTEPREYLANVRDFNGLANFFNVFHTRIDNFREVIVKCTIVCQKAIMPLLAINLPEGLFNQIRALVVAGKYSTPEAFLEVAAFSQLALERGTSVNEIASQAGSVAYVMREPSPSARKSVAIEEPATMRKAEAASPPKRFPKQVFILESRSGSVETVLEPFRLPVKEHAVPTPSALEVCSHRVFGQVNRLFPLKLICRWLHRHAVESKAQSWPLYFSVSDALGDNAAQIGSLLNSWDEVAGRKRDDQWGTGLPRKGNSASRDRFLSQFIARITRATELNPGAIYQYQLANFEQGRIALTASGIEFARISNPVLDKRGPSGATTLGDEEVRFLAKQVTTWAKGEAQDMRAVLSVVVGGIVAPTEVLAKVRDQLPGEWTDSVMTTHVGGVIARLCELQLIKRYWHGRHVEYRVGSKERLDEFMNEVHEAH